MLEVRAARSEEEVNAAIRCCGLAFGNGEPQRTARMTAFFEKIHKKDPSFRLENTRIAALDGQVVSVVQVFDRTVRLGPARLRLAGIGSVGTHPAFRGRGYNTAVLEDTVRFLEEEAYDLSLLFTGIQDYYRRLGWQPFPYVFMHEGPVSHPLPPVAFEGRLRPARWEEDLEALIEIHALADAEAAGPIVRTPELWRSFELWRGFDRSAFTVAESGAGRVVAYRLAGGHRWEEERFSILEVQSLPGHEVAALALVADFYNKLLRAGEPTMRIYGNPLILRDLERLGLAFRPKALGGTMYRLIRPESAVLQLAIANLQPNPMPGPVIARLRVGSETLTFRVEGRRVERLEDATSADWELELTQGELIALLFGQEEVPSSRSGPWRSEEGAERAFWKRLFPSRPYRWYVEDNF
ncbi:MAG: hypothetical protein KatS3mg115_0297 [Candidatus Poribacteria bacterium]|nr:MAG: hypothetical protein KatS3mg115_0297 [Candidatus Poribacteria bacterium]